MKITKTYYQPLFNNSDKANYCGVPKELTPNKVFATIDECETWLVYNNYSLDDFWIYEFHNNDIKNPMFIDSYGNIK